MKSVFQILFLILVAFSMFFIYDYYYVEPTMLLLINTFFIITLAVYFIFYVLRRFDNFSNYLTGISIIICMLFMFCLNGYHAFNSVMNLSNQQTEVATVCSKVLKSSYVLDDGTFAYHYHYNFCDENKETLLQYKINEKEKINLGIKNNDKIEITYYEKGNQLISLKTDKGEEYVEQPLNPLYFLPYLLALFIMHLFVKNNYTHIYKPKLSEEDEYLIYLARGGKNPREQKKGFFSKFKK